MWQHVDVFVFPRWVQKKKEKWTKKMWPLALRHKRVYLMFGSAPAFVLKPTVQWEAAVGVTPGICCSSAPLICPSVYSAALLLCFFCCEHTHTVGLQVSKSVRDGCMFPLWICLAPNCVGLWCWMEKGVMLYYRGNYSIWKLSWWELEENREWGNPLEARNPKKSWGEKQTPKITMNKFLGDVKPEQHPSVSVLFFYWTDQSKRSNSLW